MDKAFELLNKLDPSTLRWLALGTVAIIAFFLGLLIVAFFQDREITLGPLKLGERPRKSEAKNSLSLSPPEIIVDAQGDYYLVEAGSRYHIPDPPTFNYLGEYFGFGWDDAKLMGPDEIKKYPRRRPLPSIRPHCAKDKSTELIVHRAIWGAKDIMNDVSHEVRKKISEGKLDLDANIATFGNPIQEKKWLMVAYSYDGEVNVKAVIEDDKLSLP